MSNFYCDILLSISRAFGNDRDSMISCLRVNKLWFETFIPILWKEPWKFLEKNHEIKINRMLLLFDIIVLHLPKESREFLANQGIEKFSLPPQRLLINYIKYCNHLELRYVPAYVNALIKVELEYQRYALEQEIYKLFMNTCPNLKLLKLEGNDFRFKHQLHNFPGAKTCLSELIHLHCTSTIDKSIFYGLALTCKRIEKIHIISFLNENPGLNRLIQAQQNLKNVKFRINKNQRKKDICTGLGKALMKHANSITNFMTELDREICFPPPEFYQKFKNLKVLVLLNDKEHYERMISLLNCPKLEILQLGYVTQKVLSKIISKTEGSLKYIKATELIYNMKHSRELIQIIYQHCPNLRRVLLSIDNEDFIELQQLLIKCRYLKEIMLSSPHVSNREDSIDSMQMSDGNVLLDLLSKFAPVGIDEIQLFFNWKITVEALEKFFENWKDRVPLIFKTLNVPNWTDEHFKVIDNYKKRKIIRLYKINIIR